MTKFCHDITGPIGAVNNGVECIEEDASMQEAGMALIADSAVQAIARVQFYRFAYGMLKSNNITDIHEKMKLMDDFYKASKVTLHWPEVPPLMTQKQCQILFNMLLLVAATLIRGGDVSIDVSSSDEAASSIQVKATGQTIAMDQDIDAVLHGIDSEPNAKNIQAHYLVSLIQCEDGASLTHSCNEDACNMTYQAG